MLYIEIYVYYVINFIFKKTKPKVEIEENFIQSLKRIPVIASVHQPLKLITKDHLHWNKSADCM